jgi:hypothetical protein
MASIGVNSHWPILKHYSNIALAFSECTPRQGDGKNRILVARCQLCFSAPEHSLPSFSQTPLFLMLGLLLVCLAFLAAGILPAPIAARL